MAEDLMFKFGEEMLSKLVSLAADEFTLAWNFQTELKSLQNSLKMVNALICDASSNNKTQLASVQVWLQELNVVAFDADVVLEDYAYQTLKWRVEDRKRDKVLALFSPSKNPILFRQKLAHKIRDVKIAVDEIYSRGTKIGLMDQLLGRNDTANTALDNERLTHPFIDVDSKIVGREEDVLNIVKMLCNDDDGVNLSVIAVVGLGGQGKTTLAQLVCKDKDVVKHFDNLVIWVCVSEAFVVTTILNEMVQSCTGKNPLLTNVQAIINDELGPKLKGKRYLLVLDDVWNEDEGKWDSFRSALLGISGAKGSKVMVTTRSNKVASTMQASTYPLGKLSDEESWIMFKQRAFAHGGALETDSLANIGREIVKRCLGLPLAIKVIASLMYSKKSENDWLSVQDSHLWNIEDNANRVLQTLKISYDHLSFPLKRCFCFCSSYPKDKVIQKSELIQCWMALGLLQLPAGSDQVMEDVGERHFETLLSMCLFQDSVKDEFGGIKSSKMHDIVHDLALITAQTDYSSLKSVSIVSSKHVNPRLHLRVLVLDNLSFEVDSVKKLKHLRYLDISWANVHDLTSSLTKCYNLYTVKFMSLRSVSKHVGKLINLRHLCVDDIAWSGKCWLTGIGRLTSLQTLPFFGVNREEGCHITELESLNNLRGDLVIYGLSDVENYEEAKHAFLSKKRNLRRLRLCWVMPDDFVDSYSYTSKGGDNNEYVLEGLEPHSNLKGLKIEKFQGKTFPKWMMVETQVLRNLVELELHSCYNCELIPPLGHLQHLKVIKMIMLFNVREIGLEFYGPSIGSEGVSLFPVLRELVLDFMPDLERWLEPAPHSSASKNIVFPCLEKLDIKCCPNLKYFPSNFPSLTELTVSEIHGSALKELSRMQTSLTSLSLDRCTGSEFQSLLEDFVRNNRSLTNLCIDRCDELVSLPDNLVALTKLEIRECKNIIAVQHCLPSAREVDISGCSKLIGFPSLSQVFPVMEIFLLAECNEVVALPDIRSHTCLQQLIIMGLEKLTSVPELCKSLWYLHISYCGGLTSFPEELCETLSSLKFRGCDAVVSFPDFRYLKSLDLRYRNRTEEIGLDHSSWPFPSEFRSLQRLDFGGLPKLKSLPEQIQHLTALTLLNLEDLDGLESLPDWLGNMISLERLYLANCKMLKYFPSVKAMRRLEHVSHVYIFHCPPLEERITKGNRPEWRKISHIPTVFASGTLIKPMDSSLVDE